MRSRPHPADAAARQAIAQAEGFEVSLFLGAGKWARSPGHRDLGAARCAAKILEAAHPNNHRRAMVYAMVRVSSIHCRGIHVPDDYQQPKEKGVVMSITTYSSKSNTQRAAKKALGGDAVNGVDFEVYEHKPGKFAWRSKGGDGATPDAEQGAPTKKAFKAKEPRQKKERALGKRAQAEADAREGKLPTPPDFSAETHKRYRGKLDELVAMTKADDIEGLKAYEINPCSTSPRALDRYRNLAVIALEARQAAATGA